VLAVALAIAGLRIGHSSASRHHIPSEMASAHGQRPRCQLGLI
jgi:hypothetical protein